MLSPRSNALRGCALVLAGLGAVFIQATSADAGPFFRRMFGQQCYQQQYYQQVPAQTQAAPAGSYQSNSFEPGATGAVAAPVPVPVRTNVSPSNRPSYEQFRGDRKALGKY